MFIKIRNTILFAFIFLCSTQNIAIKVVQATNVKWTGNTDKNAPLASKVPRSQKYWDDNNIERPDYAKTDAEIAAERGEKKGKTTTGKKILRTLVGALFISLWVGIYNFGMGKKNNNGLGNRLGTTDSATGTSTHTNQLANLMNYAMKMIKTDNYTESLEEKARKARLARFENTSDSKEE
jgi:hypothetical protein